MLDISKIPAGMLGNVRENLGAITPFDTSFDDQIQAMTPKEFLERYSEWHLGDSSWARTFLHVYAKATEAIYHPSNPAKA